MHRIVPQLILDNYRAGRRRGEFQAAGMFIDLSGFSTITDVLMQDGQRGAEGLTGLMYSVFEPLVRGVLEYGGNIVGIAGDGITAVYPAGVDLGSAVRNAMASAWCIQGRMASIGSLRTPHGEFPISFKIGVACGEVAWGILGSRDGRRATYYFRGTAIVESVEAEQHAGAGEIVLAPSASRLSGLVPEGSRLGLFTITGMQAALPEPRPVVQPPVDLDIARIFVPESILVQDLRGEFRQVVNLFLRIPAVSDTELQDFIVALFDLQDRYGGLISRMDFGDKGCNMLILWGAPTTYENDIHRALNFSVDLRSKAPFPISAGITFHTAHAGYFGSALFEDYTCYGWGVNLAARFMMGAGDGDIWLDERIVQRIRKVFDVEFIGEQAFKGFAQKQKVFKLAGRKAEADSLYGGVLAGRDAELQKLEGNIQPLWRGEFAGVTAIRGEAGIGKSRLIHEFKAARVFAGQDVLWAICPADQVLRSSFNPFRYWLLRYFSVLAGQDDALRLQTFNAALDRLIADISNETLIEDLHRARSFLAGLVDLHWPGSSYEQMDAEGRYDNTLLALIALLKAESLRQPVILVVEDSHYLDEDSKAFLSRLKRALIAGPAYPIAILMTLRLDAGTSLVEDGFADHAIDLVGLLPEALASLANDVLGGPAATGLIRFLNQRADGNPFFAEQILRFLQEESLLQLDASGSWIAKPGLQFSVLPADITTMLVARLDQLARQVKNVVQTASVLGREFEIQVLARMLKDDRALDDEVAEAERAAIWSALNDFRYLFRHSLLRDAAYSMQLLAHRRELHALALDALESLYGSDLGFLYPELAYHSEQASLVEKARFYLRKAGDAARDAYQNAQALDYYTRALTLTPAGELGERLALLRQRVLLHRRLGNPNLESADLDTLEGLSKSMGDPASKALVLMLQAEYLLDTGDFQGSTTCAGQAIHLAQSAADLDVALGARLILPSALLRQGRSDEAMSAAQEAQRLATELARLPEQGAALNLMGLIALEQREPASARSHFEQALAIARASSDRALEAKSLNNLGNSTGFIEGDYRAARDYYQQAYALVHERGDRPAEGIALANLGWAAGAQGDFESARAYQDRALAIAREIGDPYQEAYTLINLSAVTGIQGDASTALQFAAEACTLSSSIGDQSGQAWALLYKGHAHMVGHDLDHAQEAFQRSAAIREELKQTALAAEPLAGLVQVALERGDINAASRWTEAILAHLDAGGNLDGTEEPLRVYLACYRLLDSIGDPRSKGILQAAGRMLDAQLSRFRDADARRMYVENVPWRLAVQQAWEANREA